MTSKRDRSPLATNIVNLRKSRGWNQPELAHRVGVHVNTIKSIETDDNEGTLETRTAIAEALGVKLGDLYQDLTTKSHFEPGAEELARILHALMHAEPVTRLSALLLLTGEKRYSDELRAIPGGAPFASVLLKLPRR